MRLGFGEAFGIAGTLQFRLTIVSVSMLSLRSRSGKRVQAVSGMVTRNLHTAPCCSSLVMAGPAIQSAIRAADAQSSGFEKWSIAYVCAIDALISLHVLAVLQHADRKGRYEI